MSEPTGHYRGKPRYRRVKLFEPKLIDKYDVQKALEESLSLAEGLAWSIKKWEQIVRGEGRYNRGDDCGVCIVKDNLRMTCNDCFRYFNASSKLPKGGSGCCHFISPLDGSPDYPDEETLARLKRCLEAEHLRAQILAKMARKCGLIE